MRCVNGIYNLLKIGGLAYCECDLLWEDSGMVDIKGFPFKCDRVARNFDGYFYNDSKKVNGSVIYGGKFTAWQISVIISNMINL